MSLFKVLQIVAISGLLAAYSGWSRRQLAEEPLEWTNPGDPNDCTPRLISLAQAKALWDKDSTTFLDVRSWQDYEIGHIRGAASLPWEEFEERFPKIKRRLQKAQTIVVYCKSVDCGKSLWAALRLRAEGLSQVVIYPDGWYQWTGRSLPATHAAR